MRFISHAGCDAIAGFAPFRAVFKGIRMGSAAWTVHKFGGSSLATADLYRTVAGVLDDQGDQRQAVVVSAMGGVTDALLSAAALAANRDEAYRDALAQVQTRYVVAARDLFGNSSAETETFFAQDGNALEDVLRGVWQLNVASEEAASLVAGMGEVWSARMLSDLLSLQGRKAAFLDARDALVVRPSKLGPVVQWGESANNLDAFVADCNADVLVITGFVASDEAGRPTTLGRNGSDHSASIFAKLLAAEAIHIWTDVDGVMSADPRLVPEARVLKALSYNEALELAYFGATVLHPQTMIPAVEANIPIHIRNTLKPDVPGTRIDRAEHKNFEIKGISAMGGMALVNLEGSGMIGVPGTAQRVFGALREADISVVMISQASSEHSICFLVSEADSVQADELLRDAFHREIARGQIQSVSILRDCSVLAIVGDAMAGQPGVAAKFFSALAKAGISVRAIAQGSSERNISAVIDSGEVARALRTVHASFYLSPATIAIGVVGAGTVGSVLVDQLRAQIPVLKERSALNLRVRAIANSRQMLLGDDLPLADWRSDLEASDVALDLAELVATVRAEPVPHAVIVDCTASGEVAQHYADWLALGVHVVTPNKQANTASMAYYRQLRQNMREQQTHFLYETTVGAGLPIIQTLRDLAETGDGIARIDGIFSGSLAYLFNTYDGARPFSQLVKEALDNGYTEPDPRDDLSGMDVARKMVILSREVGLEWELSDVDVQSLVPEELIEADVKTFLERLPEHDDAMLQRLEDARSKGLQLRFIGSVDVAGKTPPKVSMEAVPDDHPFANINLTDNIVQYVTERYNANPLVVQGPGAGPEVTAGGVFADVLRLASYLGVRV